MIKDNNSRNDRTASEPYNCHTQFTTNLSCNTNGIGSCKRGVVQRVEANYDDNNPTMEHILQLQNR